MANGGGLQDWLDRRKAAEGPAPIAEPAAPAAASGLASVQIPTAPGESAPAQEDPMALFLQRQEARRQEAERAERRTIPGHLIEGAKGVPRGLAGVAGAALQGASVYGAKLEESFDRGMSGDPNYESTEPASERPLYRAGLSLMEAARKAIPVDPDYEGAMSTQIGEAGGSLVGFALPGGVVGGVARGAALRRGASEAAANTAARAGQFGTAMPMAVTASTADAYQRATEFAKQHPEFGLSESEARDLAIRTGAVAGPIEIATLGPLFKHIPEPAKKRSLAYLIRRMAETGLTEYTVENAGALIQNIAQRTYDKDHEIWDTIPEAGEPAGYAAALLQALAFPFLRDRPTAAPGRPTPSPSAPRGATAAPPAADGRTEEARDTGPVDLNDLYPAEDAAPEDDYQNLVDAFSMLSAEATPAAQSPAPAASRPRPEPSARVTGRDGQPVTTVEVPLADLQLSEDVPQFKAGADEQGIVEPLEGKFDRLGASPILVWERADGRREIVSGRHRVDLARRSGEQTIPAQIVSEADGFSAADAQIADAELNIRDNQGAISDYASYFRGTGITEAAAEQRGLLSRAKGRDGFAIANSGSDTLFDLHASGQISDAQAAAIARTAPGNEALQSLGLTQIQQGSTIEQATSLMDAVAAMRAEQGGPAPESGDLFGFDDSAMKQAEDLAKAAAAKKRAISEQLAAVRGAAKRPEKAASLGVDVKDPDGLRKRIAELEREKMAWDSWPTNADLRAQLLQEAGVEVPARPDPAAEPDAPLLTQQTEAELAERERQKQEADAAARKAREDADAKARADAEGDDFRLSGSARPADVAMAGGQADLLGATGAPREPAAPATPERPPGWNEDLEAVLKPNGEAYPTKKAAEAARKSRGLPDIYEAIEVDEGWALAEAEADESIPGSQDGDSGPLEPSGVIPEPARTIDETVALRNGPFLEQSEADALFESWKAEAARIGQEQDLSNSVIISLFDASGNFSKPYRDMGYTVVQMDMNIRNEDADVAIVGDILMGMGPEQVFGHEDIQGKQIVGIITQPPCTTMSGAGARWRAEKHDVGGEIGRAWVAERFGERAAADFDTPLEYNRTLIAITEEYIQQAKDRGAQFTVLENPVGRIEEQTGLPKPTLRFQPNHYGETYTKKTSLYGEFNPDLPQALVKPTEGSKMQNSLRSTNELDGGERSETPLRVAYAFAMANAPGADIRLPAQGEASSAAPAEESNPEADAIMAAGFKRVGDNRFSRTYPLENGESVMFNITEFGSPAQYRVSASFRASATSGVTSPPSKDLGTVSTAAEALRLVDRDRGARAAGRPTVPVDDARANEKQRQARDAGAAAATAGEPRTPPDWMDETLGSEWLAGYATVSARAAAESSTENLPAERVPPFVPDYRGASPTQQARALVERMADVWKRIAEAQKAGKMREALDLTGAMMEANDRLREMLGEELADDINDQLGEHYERWGRALSVTPQADQDALSAPDKGRIIPTRGPDGSVQYAAEPAPADDALPAVEFPKGMSPTAVGRRAQTLLRQRNMPLSEESAGAQDRIEELTSPSFEAPPGDPDNAEAYRFGQEIGQQLVEQAIADLSSATVQDSVQMLADAESGARRPANTLRRKGEPHQFADPADYTGDGATGLRRNLRAIGKETPGLKRDAQKVAPTKKIAELRADAADLIDLAQRVNGIDLDRVPESDAEREFLSGLYDQMRAVLTRVYPTTSMATRVPIDIKLERLREFEKLAIKHLSPRQEIPAAADAAAPADEALAAMSDDDLSAMIDEVAAETGAAETSKPAGERAKTTTDASGKRRPAKQSTAPERTDTSDPEAVDRTASEIAKSFGTNLSSAGGEGVKALTELFGGKGRMGSGLQFDEQTYAKAKPHFEALLRDATAAGKDLRDFIRIVLNSFGAGVKPYLMRFAQDVRAERATADAPAETAAAGASERQRLAEAFHERMSSPDGAFTGIAAARVFAGELLGRRVAPGTADAKMVDEALEAGVVLAAREIVDASRAAGRDPATTYQRLVRLYERQPNLSTRTSTSVAQQAYSTPVPLAYLASELGGIDTSTKVYEPTAGNGVLLIGADPANVTANELNPDRAATLADTVPGATVTMNDASEWKPRGKFDVMIANPPFGTVRDESGNTRRFQVDDRYQTGEIDHAIAMKALEAIPDDGAAVLIVGSINKTATSEEARSDAYNGKAKREFYLTLYGAYNVTDHFTVSGDLYTKQGAGWPVDVIVIRGRGKSALQLPAVSPPRQYASWDALSETLNGRTAEQDRGVRGEADGAPDGASDAAGSDAGVRGDGGGTRAGVLSGDADAGRAEPAAVRPGRMDGQSDAAGPSRPGREPAGSVGDRDAGADARPPAVAVETAAQRAYAPGSTARSLDTLVPVNMQDAIQKALQKFKARHGDIDAYVAERLGYPARLGDYFGAEQIDAIALAVDNIERGAGFIIGDQTGIGKGRVVAALIRYAIRSGRMPVFVTEKPNLYGDMYRDLSDTGIQEMLGREPAILMTNANEKVPLNDEGTMVLKTPDARQHNKALTEMAASGDAGAYDVVFTTYSQMQTQRGEETPRMAFLEAIGRGGVVIFDESHNAGGSEAKGRDGKASKEPAGKGDMNRALFARKLAMNAHGVAYSSATYAKRPDVMDLYATTDMRLAVSDISKLAEAISKGGVPMQQVVASMLTGSGQYVRRERSFDGISYNSPVVPVSRGTYAAYSNSLAMIHQFSERFVKGAVKNMDKALKADGKAVGHDGSTGGAGASSSSFTSIMHNLIDQMLLSIKAEEAARDALQAIENGERPVITVANTMGSFIEEYADLTGTQPGQMMNVTFNTLLERYLRRSREVTIRRPFMKKGEKGERRTLTDAEIGPAGVRAFEEALTFIREMDLGALPVSPIDYIHQRLRAAGHKTVEITGRGAALDYRGDGTYFVRRPSTDRSIAGRRKAVSSFNDGDARAIIINQAGSTGLSLHASEKFKNREKRRMIVAQPEKNIDTHMQMLGRVHRTGQVVLPEFDQLVADVPAEKRPAAVLAKKMASLNANTTAARGSAMTAKDVPDFMNEYGDIVAARVMYDSPELHELLGEPLSDTSEGFEVADAMRKVTGRIPLLPIQEQEALYETLESEYAALLEQKEAAGESVLEAKTLDLDPKDVNRKQVIAPQGGDSPFEDGVFVETSLVKRMSKPHTSERVREMIAESLELDPADVDMASAEAKGREAAAALKTATQEEMIAYRNQAADEISGDKARDALLDRVMGQWGRFQAVLRVAHVGAPVVLKMDTGNLYGMVTKIARTGNAKNPIALGTWKVTVAVADASRQITLPMSQLFTNQNAPSAQDGGATIVEPSPQVLGVPMLDAFDDLQTESRERRTIITGNILAGFEHVNNRGSIINFLDGGKVRQGILMPKDYDYEAASAGRNVAFNSADQVIAFAEMGHRAVSSDRAIEITRKDGAIRIEIAAARSRGGKYYLDRALAAAVGKDFVTASNMMRADVSADQAHRAIDQLKRLGAAFQATADLEDARLVAGTAAGTKPADPPSAGAEFSRNGSAPARGMETAAVEAAIGSQMQGWQSAPAVAVVSDWRALPEAIRRDVVAQGAYDVAGVMHEDSRGRPTVYLVAAGLRDANHARKTLAHEAVGHFGMERDPDYQAVLSDMPKIERADPAVREIADSVRADYRDAAGNPPSDDVVAMETIARMAEQDIAHPLLTRARAAVRSFLRRIGFKLPFTKAEIDAMLLRAARRLREPAGDGVAPAAAYSREPFVPPFYSAVRRAVENATEASAKGVRWQAVIRKAPDVKAEEMEWLGLTDVLRPDQRYSKEEALAIIDAATTPIEEVELVDLQAQSTMAVNFKVEGAGATLAYTVSGRNGTYQRFERSAFKSDDEFHRKAIQAALDAFYPAYEIERGDPDLELTVKLSSSRFAIHLGEKLIHVGALDGPGIESGLRVAEYDLSMAAPYVEPPSARNSDAQYSDYALQEASPDYREHLFRIPKSAGIPLFRDPHWPLTKGGEGTVVSVRSDIVEVAGGGRALLIEEIQSDWHQRGRKGGYETVEFRAEADRALEQGREEYREIAVRLLSMMNDGGSREGLTDEDIHSAVFKRAIVRHQTRLFNAIGLTAEERSAISAPSKKEAGDKYEAFATEALRLAKKQEQVEELAAAARGRLPDAPLKEGWAAYGFKAMIRRAAEQGLDKIMWTTGEVQGFRWGDGETANAMSFRDEDGTIYVEVDDDRSFQFKTEGEFREWLNKHALMPNADPIVNGVLDGKNYGFDLKPNWPLGPFYDKQLVNIAKKLGKKYGVQPSLQDVMLEDGLVTLWSMDIPAEMRGAALDVGFPMFSRASGGPALRTVSARRPTQEDREEIDGIRSTLELDVIPQARWALRDAPNGRDSASLAVRSADQAVNLANQMADMGQPVSKRTARSIRSLQARAAKYRAAPEDQTLTDGSMPPSTGIGETAREGELRKAAENLAVVERQARRRPDDQMAQERARRARQDFEALYQEVRPRFSRNGQQTESQARQERVKDSWLNQPVDRTFKFLFDVTGSTDKAGRLKAGVKLEEATKRFLLESKFDENGRFGWMNHGFEVARAGLIDRFGLSKEFVHREQVARADEIRILAMAEQFLKTLAEANVGPQEAVALQAILTGEEVGDAKMRALSEPIRVAIDQFGQEMVSLGLLDGDTYERHVGQYLHRSYMKHQQTLKGLPKWADQVMTKHRRKIKGDELKARGLKEDVTAEALLRATPKDWWGRKLEKGAADKGLVNSEWIIFDRMKPIGEGTDTAEGIEEGGPKKQRRLERVYWPADQAVPARFEAWSNRGTWTVTGTAGAKIRLRRDFTKAERESMGEILDARYNILRTFQLMAHDVANARFFRDIALNQDWSTDQPTGEIVSALDASRMATFAGVDWVKVPDTGIEGTKAKRWGDLAGRYVRPEIWRDLNELDRMQSPGTWRSLLTMWKKNKALALDTPLPTPGGWTTMGEIKAGDTLFDENGKPCQVLEVKDIQHGRPCFRVEFSDGSSIVADDEHWWFTTTPLDRRNGKPGEVRTTKEIRETLTYGERGDSRHSIAVAGPLDLPEADLPIHPYVLGAWLGDGISNGAQMCAGGRDAEEVISHLANAGVECPQPRVKNTGVWMFSLKNGEKSRKEIIRPRLRRLGVLNNKHIPQAYLRASREQRLELLRGLMDTDGWIDTNGACGFGSSIPALRDGALELLRSLGYKPTVSEVVGVLRGEEKNLNWRIHFKAYAEEAVFKLTRKKERLPERKGRRLRSGLRYITAVVPVDSVPVRCISVSSDSRLYLAGESMVATHNTARSPVVHANNIMSNFALMDLVDVRLPDLVRGIQEYRSKGEMYQEARENGAFGADMVSQELRRNVVDPLLDEIMKEARDAKDDAEGRIRFLSKIGYAIYGGYKKYDRFMLDNYQLEDELFRMATFMRHRSMGASATEAADLAREQFLNYDIRAPWVNAARQTVLPFISYTYRAVPAIATAIAHRPWKLAKYITIGYLANLLAYELEPGDEDEERRTMREHMQGTAWASIPFTDIGVQRMIRLPHKDEFDNPYFLDVWRWVPAGDVFDTGQGQIGVPAWLQFGGPLQLAFEMMLNRSAFTGRDIVDHDTDTFADAAEKRLDYLYKAWMPSAAYVPGSWHYEKLEAAISGERDMLDRPYSPVSAVASGLGVKVQPHDVQLGYYFRGNEIERKKRALIAQARQIERDKARNIGTVASRARDMKAVRDKLERLEQAAKELYGRE